MTAAHVFDPPAGFSPMRQGGTFVDTAGPIWQQLDGGRASLRLRVERQHTNPGGSVHGGLLMTLMDLALGLAVEGALRGGSHPEGEDHPITMQISCSLIAGAALGDMLEVEAHSDRVARSVAFASGRIESNGRLLATGSAVFKPPRPRAE